MTIRSGGYAFITNMIPLHALVLILMGRFSNRLYVAYSSWYAIGTLASMQVPFVGFQPVRTSEHMAALGMSLHSMRHNCVLRHVKVSSAFCRLLRLLSLCAVTCRHGSSRLCYFIASSPQEYLALSQLCSSRITDGSHHGPVVSTLCGIPVMPKSMSSCLLERFALSY